MTPQKNKRKHKKILRGKNTQDYYLLFTYVLP